MDEVKNRFMSEIPANAAPFGTETVLLVDDNEFMRTAVEQMLRRHGYVVLSAENGEHATDLMAEKGEEVQLLLTDIVMPGMNGKDLYAALSVRFPQLKVLYMTGYTDEILFDSEEDEGRFALLEKPFSHQTLTRKIREVLDEA